MSTGLLLQFWGFALSPNCKASPCRCSTIFTSSGRSGVCYCTELFCSESFPLRLRHFAVVVGTTSFALYPYFFFVFSSMSGFQDGVAAFVVFGSPSNSERLDGWSPSMRTPLLIQWCSYFVAVFAQLASGFGGFPSWMRLHLLPWNGSIISTAVVCMLWTKRVVRGLMR